MENTSVTYNFGSDVYLPLNSTTGNFVTAMNVGSMVRMVCYILLSLTIVVSNTFIIVTYWLVKEIRKDIANTFIVNLSYADLMVGLFNIPFLGIMDFFNRWLFGEIFCKIRLAWAYVNTFMPVLVIVLLTAFHRLRMSRNHTYRNAVKQVHVNVIMAACWFFEASFDLFVAFGFPVITRKRVLNYDYVCDMEFPYISPGFTIFFVILKFMIPLVIFVALSVNLFLSIRKMSNRINDSHSGSGALDMSGMADTAGKQSFASNTVNVEGNGEHPLTIESASGEYNQTWDHPRNMNEPSTSRSTDNPTVNTVTFAVSCQRASKTPRFRVGPDCGGEQSMSSNQIHGPGKTQGEPGQWKKAGTTKAMKQCLSGRRRSAIMLFVLVGSFLIFWTPIMITVIIHMVCPTCVAFTTFYWVYLVVYCNSLLNSFLYAATNRKFQKGFYKILQRWRRFRDGFFNS